MSADIAIFKVKNTTRIRRFIYNRKLRTVGVPPNGGEVTIEMFSKNAYSLRGRGFEVTLIRELTPDASPANPTPPADRAPTEKVDPVVNPEGSGSDAGGGEGEGGEGGASGEGEGEQNPPSEARSAALALLASYEAKTINFLEFTEKAKELLGPRWPGGTPKKAVIIELLNSTE